jgi:hypothetical protein
VHKELWLWREIKVDDIINQWDVNPTSGDVGGDEQIDLLGTELGHMDFTSCLSQ